MTDAELAAKVRAAAEETLSCAVSWEPEARPLGNVRAADLAACARALAAEANVERLVDVIDETKEYTSDMLDAHMRNATLGWRLADLAESIARRALVEGLAECKLQRWRAEVAGGAMMVAALYVQPPPHGCYQGLPDVDPWDEARDARKYDGPYVAGADAVALEIARLARVARDLPGSHVKRRLAMIASMVEASPCRRETTGARDSFESAKLTTGEFNEP